MEPQTAFIRAESTVELDTKTTVYTVIALVILPGNPKDNLPFGLDKAMKNPGFDIFRMVVQNRTKAIQYLFDGLVKFDLAVVAFQYFFVNFLNSSTCVRWH